MKRHAKVIRAIDRAINDLAASIAGMDAHRLHADFERYSILNLSIRAIPDAVVDGRRVPTTRRQREFLSFLREAAPLLRAREALTA